MNNRISYFIAFILIALIAALSIHSLNISNKLEASQVNIEQANDSIKLLQLQSDLYISILDADAMLIDSGNAEKSLSMLQTIGQQKNKVESLIKRRINNLQQLLEKRAKSQQSKEDLEMAYHSLERKYDVLIGHVDSLKKTDAAQTANLKYELTQLKDSISDLRQKLERKNNIQVITFNGRKQNKIHYLGEVVDQKANGGGVGIWQTGSIYKGTWKDNKRHGKGTFEWVDGERYEGEYENDIRTGEGTYYWPSGEKYVGGWQNDQRNGEGTLYDIDGNVRYRGTWKDDKPVSENTVN